jgi:hypothetical protein
VLTKLLLLLPVAPPLGSYAPLSAPPAMPPLSEGEMVAFITLSAFAIWFSVMFIGIVGGEYFAKRRAKG